MIRRGWKDYQTESKKRNFSWVKRGGRSITRISNSFAFLFIAALLLTTLTILFLKRGEKTVQNDDSDAIFSKVLATLKPSSINSEGIFKSVSIEDEGDYFYTLSLDRGLQMEMEKLLERYAPPYAGIVAMDPDTGAIRAMASYSKSDGRGTNWCLKSSFSAASIFKLVTAAAAIDKINMQESSVVGFNGGLYRLHERNVFDRRKRYSNRMTLGEAFAKSVNIVFAKLTQKGLKSEDLVQYSSSFLYNKPIPFDLEVEESVANIPDEDFRLAKTAAGFGDVTLSPLHGAVMVSAMLNGGNALAPYLLEKIYDSERKLVYKRHPTPAGSITDARTARMIKDMMEMTLTRGTIRKGFRGWSRDRVLSDLNIGGKTGSINGRQLLGEHNWFVGFAEEGSRRLVVSAVLVNHALWHIKPTYLAKTAFQKYFSTKSKDKFFVASR